MLIRMTVEENAKPLAIAAHSGGSCKIEGTTVSYAEKGQHASNILVIHN